MNTNTFIRDYQLTIALDGRGVQIKPPMKIAFSCIESIGGEANKMTVEIYGLSRENRISLTRDEDEKTHIGVELMVGYKGNLALLFKGSLLRGAFDRQGADFITTLDCIDGGNDILWSYTNAVVKGKEEAINQCVGDMEITKKGVLPKIKELIRPKVLVGNSAMLIKSMMNQDQDFFISREQAHVLGEKEYRKTLAPLVSAVTGLTGVPQSAKKEMVFNTMLNPMIELGGVIKLQSVQNPKLDGLYKVKSISTNGESHGDSWFQDITAVRADDYKEIE